MAVPQDNPDLDLLPPPYAHYAQLHANGGVYSSLHRLSSGSSGNNHTDNHLVHMTYLDGPPATSMSTQSPMHSPQARSGRVMVIMLFYISIQCIAAIHITV